MKEQTAYSSNQPPSHANIDAVNTRINYLSFYSSIRRIYILESGVSWARVQVNPPDVLDKQSVV